MTRRLAALATLVLLLVPAAARGHDQTLHASPDLTPFSLQSPLPTGLDRLLAGATAAAAAAASFNFQLVGHEPLFARGMNAAPAIFGHYVYVGNRTDGSPQHPRPGVLVVDIGAPAHPKVVGEIGLPNEGNLGETSRELRVWPEKKLLMVMNFQCSALIHACTSPEVVGVVPSTIRFYDLTGANAANPQLLATYRPSRTPHEMFLWVDPLRHGRALLYLTTPTTSTTQPNLIVTDISRAREGVFTEVAKWNGTTEFPSVFRNEADVRLHSIGLSMDGRRTYLAYLGAGFLVLDSSDVANAVASPQLRLVTKIQDADGNGRLDHPNWGNPGAHSAVKVPGRPYALVTDEVYGDFLDAITGDNHGCPWGWVRMIDISNEVLPKIVGEYRSEQNVQSYCDTPDGGDPANTTFTSYSSHNPTLVGKLALVTWHSAGLHAFSTAHPTQPLRTGLFSPAPLPFVATEDPALSLGRNKVVMWSYPIIKDGLIYVVDIRNGLYVLRYTGPSAKPVSRTRFLEGNSNLGGAAPD